MQRRFTLKALTAAVALAGAGLPAFAQETIKVGVLHSLSGTLSMPAMILSTVDLPAIPLAGWTLWTRRANLAAKPQLLPLALFFITLLMLALAYRPRKIPALLLLPPLALLATPGALTLRRGAANAFDWFAMMTFSVFVALVWLCWSAMALGWPEKLAKRVVVLRPGFVDHFEILALLVGLAATLWWIWLIVTAPRSHYRSLTHLTMGFYRPLAARHHNYANASNGVNYYLVVKHKNSITTWSNSGYTFSGNLLSFDFTTAASKAYGNNQVLKGSRYAIYSGDINQDEVVDGTDGSLVDHDASLSVSGYVTTDVTGDDFVDAADVSIVDNNAYNLVSLIRP